MFNANSILSMPSFNSLSLVSSLTSLRCGCQSRSTWITNFLLFNKIGENPVVTPSAAVQVVRPSAINRYLQSVTVEATGA